MLNPATGWSFTNHSQSKLFPNASNPLQLSFRMAKALLKAGEKAYASVQASLQEEKTVGYSVGTTGISVRVAKGVTLRTSGTRR